MRRRALTASRRYVLLDRDGTVIAERHYLSRPEQLEFAPCAILGLRELVAMGLGLVVVTNQSGIGRGLFSLAELQQVHEKFKEMLAAEGIQLDGVYFCPHTPADHCSCRKPLPGLAEQAARDLDFNPKQAFVVGDKGCDVGLGRNLGAITFLVKTGYGSEAPSDVQAKADFVADNLLEVARIIRRLTSGQEELRDGIGR